MRLRLEKALVLTRVHLDHIVSFVLFIGSVLYSFSYYSYGLDMLDEGCLVDPVIRIMDGQLPYRDFIHGYAPGSFYLFAGLFKVFGANLLVIRGFWAILHGFLAVFAYLVARKMASPFFSILPAVILSLAPGPWHKGFFIFPPFLCLWVFYNTFEKEGRTWYIFSGLTAVAAFFLRQDIGVFAAIVFCVLYALHARIFKKRTTKDLFFFLAAFAGPLIIVMVYWWSQNALGASLNQIFFAAVKGVTAISAGMNFPSLFPLWSSNLQVTATNKIYYLPFLIYIIAIFCLVYKFATAGLTREDIYFIGLIVFGVLVLHEVRVRSDMAHLWQVIPLSLVAAVVLLQRAFQGRWLRRCFAVLLSAMLTSWFIFVGFTNATAGSIAIKKGNDYRLSLFQARVYVPKDYGIELEKVVKYIKINAPGRESMLAVPDITLLYFLANKKNPTYIEYYFEGTSYVDPFYQKRVIADITTKKVEYVIINKAEVNDGMAERSFAYYARRLNEFIHDNYHKVYETKRFEVLKRNGVHVVHQVCQLL